MKREFLECSDEDICQIKTSNYDGIQTDLRTEWEFATNPIPDKIYPGTSLNWEEVGSERPQTGHAIHSEAFVRILEQLRTPGLKWEEISLLLKKEKGTEIENEELVQALRQQKLVFTPEELNRFNVQELSFESYVKVDNKYFRPAAPQKLEFTKEQLEAFNMSDLSFESYVKVYDKYFSPKPGAGGRQPDPLAKFLKHEIVGKARLTRPEVIGLRLYTGPAYMAINGALRLQLFRIGKMSCRKCFKGKYAISQDGRSPCIQQCKKCARCKANFMGWKCHVEERGKYKKILYERVSKQKEDASCIFESREQVQKFLEERRGASEFRINRIVPEAFDFDQRYVCPSCVPGADCFSTCVAVINSAIYKLTQETPLAEGRTLYRGINGMTFPEELLLIDETPEGIRGFVEFAFSSATPDRKVAIEYSGGHCKCAEEAAAAAERGEKYEGGWVAGDDKLGGYCEIHRSTILEIETGQVDRGARLDWVSQFAAEKEHTLLPLSNFEVTGMRREGHLNILELKLNLNLHAQTLEQLRARRQTACLEFGIKLLQEGTQILSGTSVISKDKVQADVKRILDKIRCPSDADAKNSNIETVDLFNDTDRFRRAINECFADWRSMMSEAAANLLAYAEGHKADYDFREDADKQDNLVKMEPALMQALLIFKKIKQDNSLNEIQAKHEARKRKMEEELKQHEWENQAVLRLYDLLTWLIPKLGMESSSHKEFAKMLAERGEIQGMDGENFDEALNFYEQALKFSEDGDEEDTWEAANILMRKGCLLEKRGQSNQRQEADFERGLQAFQQSLTIIKDLASEDEKYIWFVADITGKIGLMQCKHFDDFNEGWSKVEEALARKLCVHAVDNEKIALALWRLREMLGEREAQEESMRTRGSNVDGIYGEGHYLFQRYRIFEILFLRNDPNLPDSSIEARIHQVLGKLSKNSDDLLNDITGHIKKLQDTLKNSTASQNVLEWGCTAVASLARIIDIHSIKSCPVAEEFIQNLVGALVKYPEHIGVQREVCCALAALFESTEIRAKGLMSEELCHRLVVIVFMALDVHRADECMQKEGLRVVRHLLCGSTCDTDVSRDGEHEADALISKTVSNGAVRILLQSLDCFSKKREKSQSKSHLIQASMVVEETVLCILEILERFVCDEDAGPAAARTVAFFDGQQHIKQVMADYHNAEIQSVGSKIKEAGSKINEKCEWWCHKVKEVCDLFQYKSSLQSVDFSNHLSVKCYC